MNRRSWSSPIPPTIGRGARLWLILVCLKTLGVSVLAAQTVPRLELVIAIPPAPGIDDPAFHQIIDIDLDPVRNEIYVVDNLRTSVRVFSMDGRLIREFARRGAGPGELGMPIELSIVGSRVYIPDYGNRRLTWYRLDGRYEGDRTFPYLEPGELRSRLETLPVRHGQALSATGPAYGSLGGSRPDMEGRVVLVSSAGNVTQTISRYHYGTAYAYRKSNPNRTSFVASFGPGGVWAVSGDSMYVFADTYRGKVEWFRIDRGRATLQTTRNLNWRPVPLRFSSEEIAELQKREAGTAGAPGDVVIVPPEFAGTIARMLVASNGDIWLQRRTWTSRRPSPFAESYVIVPYRSAGAVMTIDLPANFSLRSVVGDVLLGAQLDADEVQTVRLFRMIH